eukprot:TRINITY_DN4692_c0_g1_i4.p1 TRINITY_DN4692_c0_g1~~TRINITY_DN4692_c0_g1_i4.p1  ORF type:complete len:153 (+),score=14.60 TRINITY_DN4692_c0_g1_i4:39-497(+)
MACHYCTCFFFKGYDDHRDLHYPLRRQRQMCIRDRFMARLAACPQVRPTDFIDTKRGARPSTNATKTAAPKKITQAKPVASVAADESPSSAAAFDGVYSGGRRGSLRICSRTAYPCVCMYQFVLCSAPSNSELSALSLRSAHALLDICQCQS